VATRGAEVTHNRRAGRRRKKITCRTHFDLHTDAELGFTDATFEQRFLAFRHT
jgi:hypothetical protein